MLIALCLALVGCSGSSWLGAGTQGYDGAYEEAVVTKIVDGDTLCVRYGTGEECRLRLIGINTPESVSSDESQNCPEGELASQFMESLVHVGDTVYTVQDVSNTDKYGRLLRYVWLELPDNWYDLDEISTKMLNGILVAQGYAEAKEYEPDTAYAPYFDALMATALDKDLGLAYFWKDPNHV